MPASAHRGVEMLAKAHTHLTGYCGDMVEASISRTTRT